MIFFQKNGGKGNVAKLRYKLRIPNPSSVPDASPKEPAGNSQSSQMQKIPVEDLDSPTCVALSTTPQILSSLSTVNCKVQEMNSPKKITKKLCNHKTRALYHPGT